MRIISSSRPTSSSEVLIDVASVAASNCASSSRWPLHGAAMHAQGACERLDGRQQLLLQPRDEQGGLLALRLTPEPLLAQLAILVEQPGEAQLGGVGRPAVDVDLLDLTLREASLDGPDVHLESADHDVVERLLALDRHAAAESLRIEDLQQSGEAVGMGVVWGGRQEQAVLEARRQLADRSGDLRVDGVA
jgi:hypothetical protein